LKHSPPSRGSSSLLDLSVRELLDALGSEAPAPGGGAAAALGGALGAALVQMTANLTLGRPRLADVQEQARAIEAEAARLRQRLEGLAQADADAYAYVTAAYRLPRDTDEQRSARSAAIQSALGEAARVPLEVAEACGDVLAACEAAAPVLNPSVISDVVVGALLAHAGLEAGAVNVEVNLASMSDALAVERLANLLARARAGKAELLSRILATARSRSPRS
jgi:formiminotetrahydrofolate cyclodeaminase